MLNIDTRLLDEVKKGNLTPDEFFILLCISKRVNRSNSCFPSMKLLQEETTFGYNKVFDSLKSLNQKGYITKERRRVNGKLTSNLYVLHTKYTGVYISVDNQEFLPPQNQAVENQAVENQTLSINQSSLSINQSSLSQKSNFEIIDNFFNTTNIKDLIQSKLLPYENQTWWQEQATITITEIKERMIKYYTEDKKGKKAIVKDPEARFCVFLKSYTRQSFYKNKPNFNQTTPTNPSNYPAFDIYQHDGESTQDFQERAKQRQLDNPDKRYNLHYTETAIANDKFLEMKQNLVNNMKI